MHSDVRCKKEHFQDLLKEKLKLLQPLSNEVLGRGRGNVENGVCHCLRSSVIDSNLGKLLHNAWTTFLDGSGMVLLMFEMLRTIHEQ